MPVHHAVGQAVRDDVFEDEEPPVVTQDPSDIEIVRAMLGENTPLLKGGKRRKSSTSSGRTWLRGIRRPSGE